jgi:hypothetical protein
VPSEHVGWNQVDALNLLTVRSEHVNIVATIRSPLEAVLGSATGAGMDHDDVAAALSPLALNSKERPIRSEQEIPPKAVVHRPVNMHAQPHRLGDDRRLRDRPLLVRGQHT